MASSKDGSPAAVLDEELFFDGHPTHDPRPNRGVLGLARQCLSMLKEKALAPTGLAPCARPGHPGGIWMYFWDGNNYADLELSNDGRVTLCFNLAQDTEAGEDGEHVVDRWQSRGNMRFIEGYAVEPDEAGLRSAIRMILKHVDRSQTLKRC